MNTPKNIVETWTGPVCDEDRYYPDVDEAVVMIIDRMYPDRDPLHMPEYVECCEESPAILGAQNVVESMENYDENVHSDDNWAMDAVTPELLAKLQTLLDAWLLEIPWRCWKNNGKFIRVRDEIERQLKELEAQ